MAGRGRVSLRKNEPAHNPRAHGRPPTVAPFRAWRGSEIPTSPEDSGPALARSCCRVWRRGWDLNPRSGSPDTRFPVVHLRPLGHLSRSIPRRDREIKNGERGIRTPGTVAGTPDFESGAFDRARPAL